MSRYLNVEDILKKLQHYCAYQDRCHKEVAQKMRTFTLSKEAEEYIWNILIEEDFLNEERYAESYTRGAYRQKQWGKRKILENLKQRDISPYCIKQAFASINEEEYSEILKQNAEKKLIQISGRSEYEKKQKLIRFLQSRGYEWEEISPVVEQLF